MKQLRKVWRFTLPELLQNLCFIIGSGIFGILIVFLIVKIAKTDDYAAFAGFFAFLMWGLTEIWTGMVCFGKNFAMMVSMSRTRKEFFGAYLLSNFVGNCIKAAAVVGITFLEKVWQNSYYEGLTCDLDISGFLFDYRVIIATVLLALGLRMLLGVLYLKYQMIIFWVLWGLTMCGGLFAGTISKVVHGETSNIVVETLMGLAEKFMAAGGLIQIMIIGVIFGVMTAIAGILTSKQAVKC